MWKVTLRSGESFPLWAVDNNLCSASISSLLGYLLSVVLSSVELHLSAISACHLQWMVLRPPVAWQPPDFERAGCCLLKVRGSVLTWNLDLVLTKMRDSALESLGYCSVFLLVLKSALLIWGRSALCASRVDPPFSSFQGDELALYPHPKFLLKAVS